MRQGWKTYPGAKFHYVNDEIHNDNGPAVIMNNGNKYWYKNDKLHREDGPAIEYKTGNKEWPYKGERLGWSILGYTQKDFEQWLKFRVFL